MKTQKYYIDKATTKYLSTETIKELDSLFLQAISIDSSKLNNYKLPVTRTLNQQQQKKLLEMINICFEVINKEELQDNIEDHNDKSSIEIKPNETSLKIVPRTKITVKQNSKLKTKKKKIILINYDKDNEGYESSDIENNEDNQIEKPNNYVVILNDDNKESFLAEEKAEEAKIKKYNRYTEKNPMKYVNKIISKGNPRWKFKIVKTTQTPGQEKVFKLENKEKAIDLATKQIIEGKNISTKKRILFASLKIHYNNKITFLHNHENEIYVDLNMAINNLELNNPEDKYTCYKSEIAFHLLKQNDFGGYIIKPMISETTYYNLLLNSESKFAKKFKEDIAKLITDIRKSGQLKLTDNGFELDEEKNSNTTILQEEVTVVQDLHNKILSQNEDELEKVKYFMFSNQFIETLEKYTKEARNINLVNYLRTSVMYMFCVFARNGKRKGLSPSYVYIKVGWTLDFAKRWYDLKGEYGANFYLMKIVTVEREKNEQDFHKRFKTLYPYLISEITILGTKKEEIYLANQYIIDMFNQEKEYKDFTKTPEIREKGDEVIENEIKNQYDAFIDDLNYVRSTLALIEDTNLTDNQTNLMINLSDNNHQRKLNKHTILQIRELKELEYAKKEVQESKTKMKISDKDIVTEQIKLVEAEKIKELEIIEAKKRSDIEIIEAKKRNDIETNNIHKDNEIEIIKAKYHYKNKNKKSKKNALNNTVV